MWRIAQRVPRTAVSRHGGSVGPGQAEEVLARMREVEGGLDANGHGETQPRSRAFKPT